MKKLQKIDKSLFSPLKKEILNQLTGGGPLANFTYTYCEEPTNDPKYECGDIKLIYLTDLDAGVSGWERVRSVDCLYV